MTISLNSVDRSPTSRHREQPGHRWLVAIAAVALLAQSGVAEARSFLWSIEKKGEPVSYLLGSIHLGRKSFYPLAPAIQKAFALSKVLVLEARPDEMAKAAALVMEKGMLLPPRSLKAEVSAKTYRLAVKKGKELGLPQAAIDRMRPWLLGLTFSAQELQKAGYDPQWGIEMVLLKRKPKKKIAVLEGAAFQINLLSGFTKREQEFFLLYSIEQAKLARGFMKKMIKAWKRGNTRGLDRQMTLSVRKTPELRGVYRRLVTDRNISMAKTISTMLKAESTPHFFVIGAGHLVGAQNIPKRLRALGYRLTQL